MADAPDQEAADPHAARDSHGDAAELAKSGPDTGGKAASARKSSPIGGVIGFILALGAGFFIGQWLNNRGKDDVEIAAGPRYRVALRGNEPSKGPEDALVTVIEFADYQCPYCARAAGPLDEVAASYDDEVRVLYKHYPLPGHAKAGPAARAAWAALQQGKFWELHAWLFGKNAELDQLDAKVAELGLDRARFLADMVGEDATRELDEDLLAGGRLGVSGTPVFFVNGHRYVGAMSASQWRGIIAAELDEAERLVDAGTAPAQVYDAILRDALETEVRAPAEPRAGEPDPRQVYRVELGDAPPLGPADALVTVVVFSDFQCPYCARVAPIVHQLVAQAPDVRVVLRNLPLAKHARARDAARAALAAGRQGKYWEMHDKLFAVQDRLADADMTELAGELGLDRDRFAADFADSTLEQTLERDVADAARLGVTGTPAAFVNGRFISGAQPIASFEALIANARDGAKALVDAGTPPDRVYETLMQTALATPAATAGGS